MPQMKPINWLTYFILFSMFIMFINILNFFIKINNMKMNYSKKNKLFITWKW